MPASLSDVFYLRIDPSDPGAIAARILRDVRSHLDERHTGMQHLSQLRLAVHHDPVLQGIGDSHPTIGQT